MFLGHLWFYFIVGCVIGFVSVNLINFEAIKRKSKSHGSDVSEYEVEPNSMKILCVLSTSRDGLRRKAIHVKMTWGRHCDKLIIITKETDTNLGAVGFNVQDDYIHLWAKTKFAFHYIYENFADEYDWIYKGDDDTFAIIENLRYLLAPYSPQDPISFGHRLKTMEANLKYGFFSGGSGYVISNQALKLFAEEILKNLTLCQIKTDIGKEDVSMAQCLDVAGVRPVDTRDPLKRERFLPMNPHDHLFLHLDKGSWMRSYNYFTAIYGLDCCSNYTVSTHYIQPQNLYTLYFLAYKLQVVGIRRNFPPPARPVYFEDILKANENERLAQLA